MEIYNFVNISPSGTWTFVNEESTPMFGGSMNKVNRFRLLSEMLNSLYG